MSEILSLFGIHLFNYEKINLYFKLPYSIFFQMIAYIFLQICFSDMDKKLKLQFVS